jgi:arylsulfatase A-like enzyme
MRTDRVIGFEDWLPTLLELTGSSSAAPARLDGISFAPTLMGKSQEPRPFLYREFPQRGGAQFVRQGNWKLIRHLSGADAQTREFVGNGPNRYPPGALDPEQTTNDGTDFELFDLAADPSEQVNIARQHADIVERLTKIMDEQHEPSKLFRLPIDRKEN